MITLKYLILEIKDIQFEYHNHDFNKIIIFINGNVTYFVDGIPYKLKPWDILLSATMKSINQL